jgi:hypothetical protein
MLVEVTGEGKGQVPMHGLMGDRFLKWFVGNLLHRSKSNPPNTAGIKPERIKETVSRPVSHEAEADLEREGIENIEPKENPNPGTGKNG